MPERLWKFLNEDGSPCYSGSGRWSLPKDGKPGDWMPAIVGEIIPCKRGYHACRDQDLRAWLGPTLYQLEARGEIQTATDKVVCREARLLSLVDTWNKRTTRLFACDCAERVLPIFESWYPEDPRPRQAVEVARRYACGEATRAELAAAMAAGNGDGGASYAAMTASYAATTDAGAAANVARGVARLLAKHAAYATGYDLAWGAATLAAGYGSAAAAWSATNTPMTAAGAAERQWQTERLLWYLEGGSS